MKAALIVLAALVFVALASSGPFWVVELGTGLGGAGLGLAGVVAGVFVAVVLGVIGLVVGGIVALMAGPFALVVTVLALLFAAIVTLVALAAGLAPIVIPVALVLAVVWLIARRPASERNALALPPPQPR